MKLRKKSNPMPKHKLLGRAEDGGGQRMGEGHGSWVSRPSHVNKKPRTGFFLYTRQSFTDSLL